MFFCSLYISALSQNHPNLILTKQGIENIQRSKNSGLFTNTVKQAIIDVDQLMEDGINVPVPKDLAGGYTHEVHKRNFLELYKAGALYQILGDVKYAEFTKNVLLAYADLYPTLERHPSDKSYAPGKLFWQCLNDANWLVYMSQAYDNIYDYLSVSDRTKLESQLFRPFADFISLENPRFYNRIHNHSTWGNAAVGMIALVMNDEALLERALYGIPDLLQKTKKEYDNDGGLINPDEQNEAGFYAQMNHSFSPDGYYTEGPYYQRYAMSPFLFFGQALHNSKPELEIFAFKEGILVKSIYALLNLTDSHGQFYPINDAQKGMSYKSRELVAAVDIIYNYNKDPKLLSVAKDQGVVQLDQTGFLISTDVEQMDAPSFVKKSMMFRDGAHGKKGGLSVLRTTFKDNNLSCLFKYSAQGMGHGHFDRLSYSFYNNEVEVLQDYGAARWVNIDQKAGGRYLKENKTWAKQSIAHNTIVKNKTSHFKGNTQVGEAAYSQHHFSNFDDSKYQITSAIDVNAYADTDMLRTLIMVNDSDFYPNPLLVDVFSLKDEGENDYDLPFHFGRHLLNSSLEPTVPLNALETLGDDNGYQHVWQEGLASIAAQQYSVTWMNSNKLYTMHGVSNIGDEIVFARVGANDPHFNLRHDAFFIHRKKSTQSPTYVSVINAHGEYSPVSEIPTRPYPQEIKIDLLLDNEEYTVVKLMTDDSELFIMLSKVNSAKDVNHNVKIKGTDFNWKGPYKIFKNKK